MTKPPTRLGVVGTGLIWSTTHKPALYKLKDEFDVVALCARTDASRRSAASDFPSASVFDDYHALSASREIDAVVVCTPIALNAAVAIEALKAGKDVYLEKPFATSTAEADTILEAETDNRGTVYILEQLLYSDICTTLDQVIGGGEIGQVASWDKVSSGFIDTKVDPWGYGKTQWRVSGDFPLGPLFDGGVHEIALHAQIFGPVARVAAHGQKLRPEHGEFDNIQMLFIHENGTLGMFGHSGFLGGSRNPFHIRGVDGLVSIEADRLMVERKLGGERTIPLAPTNMHDQMWAEFARLRGTGVAPKYSSRLARHDIATLEAIQRAIHTGVEQRVEG